MNFHVITIFPEVCRAYTDSSVLGRAQRTNKGKGAKMRGKKISVSYYNPRDFTADKHGRVDGRPFGGGPGMVMQAEPILKAWTKAVGRKQNKRRVKTIILSPRGKTFTQKLAREYAKKYDHLVLISGRYEGIDGRVKKITRAEEVSVGDYILTGGELPALSIVDAIARQLPGVLGHKDSLEEGRVAGGEVYTRPDRLSFKGKTYQVPAVLLSGHHEQIEKWRKEK